MTRPYSEDIRERALARADAGETVRSIAEALQISASCVTKWKNLRRDTGGLSPGQIGGHKKRVLSDANADWLRKRIRSGPFTLRKLTQELAARGIKTDVRAVWTFCSHRRAQLQKKRFYQPSRIVPTSPVSGPAGKHIKAGSTSRGWCLSTRRGSKPIWHHCAAGGLAGSASKPLHLSAIGRQ
ncbi:transposase [Bradyrhizobium vignae]|nr:transposase [Bradyrhizobium vignae]